MGRQSVRVTGLAFALVSGAAQAGARTVAYDTISSFSPLQFQVFPGVPLQAEDTTLDPAAGLVLSRLSLLTRLRSGVTYEQFNGTMTARLYASDGAGKPGGLLYEGTQNVSIARGTDQIVSFDVPSVAAPSAKIYAAWYFMRGVDYTAYNDVWVRQSGAGPSPGSTDQTLYAGWFDQPASTWQPFVYDPPRNYAVRIETVPAPAALPALLVLAVRRRRL